MHRLTYAETSFLTDTRIAQSLMAYARTLAVVGQADVVAIPGLDETGATRIYELVVGPASQMIAYEVEDVAADLPVEAVLSDLEQRQARHLPQLDAENFPDLATEERESEAPPAGQSE